MSISIFCIGKSCYLVLWQSSYNDRGKCLPRRGLTAAAKVTVPGGSGFSGIFVDGSDYVLTSPQDHHSSCRAFIGFQKKVSE